MSSRSVLVLFGSHRGMADGIRQRNEANLVELIQLRHNIRVDPRNFVRKSNQVIGKFKEFYAEDGEEKFVYYVGDGNQHGDLCFDDGNFSLENVPLPPMDRDFKIHVYLFMPYHEKASDAFQKFQVNNRNFLEHTAFTCDDRGLDDLYDELQKLRQQNN